VIAVTVLCDDVNTNGKLMPAQSGIRV